MDVESVSDELYGLPLDEFTPTRTDREKQARSAGDLDLAAQIHQLAKPNLVAWLANQLAREGADEIQPLLQLGEALREATATGSGEQLRELSRQQHQVVFALVKQAGRLADAAGRKVSPDTTRALENTLRAALADPGAADALSAGRLTEGMLNSGFGTPTSRDGSQARSAKKLATSPTSSPPSSKRTPEPRKRAELEVVQAQSASEAAIAAREKTQAQLETAARAVAETGSRTERLRRELDESLHAQSSAQKDQQRAKAAFVRADRDARDAQKRLVDATQRLDRLAL